MKGKSFLVGLIAFAAGVFVCKNKWCQEKIQNLKEKGEAILNNKKCNCQEEKPAEENAAE